MAVRTLVAVAAALLAVAVAVFSAGPDPRADPSTLGEDRAEPGPGGG